MSRSVAKINEYTNCLYICGYCNKARGAQPIRTDKGQRLLNPCDDIWDHWFVLVDDKIEPRQHEPAALYTITAYDLNDPNKIKRRWRRRTAIQDRCEFIEQAASMRRNFLERAMRALDSELIEFVRLLEWQLRSAWADLERYQAIPSDAKCPCACDDKDLCRLPEVFEDQILEVEAPFIGRHGFSRS